MKREHDTDSPACWCGPDLFKPCVECPVEPGHVVPRADCWKCGGKGLVPVDPKEADFEDGPIVIVHQETAP